MIHWNNELMLLRGHCYGLYVDNTVMYITRLWVGVSCMEKTESVAKNAVTNKILVVRQ